MSPTNEPRYFIARGRSREIIEAWQALHRAYRDWMNALADELGAAQTVTMGLRLFGFVFDEGQQVPRSLRRHPKHDCFVPNGRTKAGRDLAERIESQRGKAPSREALTCDLVGDLIYTGEGRNGGLVMANPGIACLGDDWIVIVPAGKTADGVEYHDPPDAEPMKASDYWLRVEAAKAAA